MDWKTQVEALGDRGQAEPAQSFPSDPARQSVCGLYAWWADEEARCLIGAALGAEVPALIYVGKAGGGSSHQTLLGRIRGKHIRGSIRTSTLRRTLTAILMADPAFRDRHPDPSSRETKQAVSAWMAQHLHVVTLPVPDPSLVAEAEAAAIARFDPPLNLDDTLLTPTRARLKELRSHLSRGGAPTAQL